VGRKSIVQEEKDRRGESRRQFEEAERPGLTRPGAGLLFRRLLVKITLYVECKRLGRFFMPSKTALDMTPDMLRQYRPFKAKEDRGATAASMEEARRVAAEIADALKRRFGAKRVLLFGSLARGEFDRWSDIDLAAWGIPAPDFYRAVSFATGVSSSWKVDLIDGEDCPASLRAVIDREGMDL
jgi:predicted nucleotidyltransferase